MKKFIPVFLMVIIFLAIGCARENEVVTPLPSATSTIQETAVSTPTPTPPPTKTLNSTITAVPTETPTFQAYATPTFFPVLTPPAPADNFQLQSWDESTALNLVEKAKNYADNVYEHHDDWYLKQAAYPEAQSLVELTIYEVFSRYPDTSHRENLEWQLAFAEAIQRKPEASQRLVSLLQTSFNHGDYTVSSLQSDIEKHNFHILETNYYGTPYPTTASNLFGHDQESSIIVMSTNPGEMGFDEGGVVLAISSQNAAPEVHYVDDFWSRGSGSFSKIIIDDTTGNEQNEVITILWDPNCHAYISVMEWQETHFVDLVRPSEAILGECRSSWDVQATDTISEKSLVATTYHNFYPTHIFTDTYQWDGSLYEHINRKNQFPNEIDDRFIFDWESYFKPGERLKLYEELMSNPENSSNLTQEDVYFELLKFKKGMIHLYLGETEAGLDLLQQVAHNSNNLTPTAIAQSANVYLETFSSPSDSFQACANALQVLDEALGNDLPENYEEIKKIYIERWGFYYPSARICNLQTNLEIVVNDWNDSGIAKETAVPDLLERSGITPVFIESIDLNGDNVLDWLLSLQPATNYLVSLITTNEGLVLLPIDSLFQYPSPDEIGLETINLPGTSSPINILHASNRPKIFAIETKSEQPYVREWLEDNNQLLQYSQQNGDDEIIAFVDQYLSINSYSEAVYRWNPETQDFELVKKRAENSLGIPLDEAITQAETLILQEGDFEAAIPTLTAVLTELNTAEELTYAIPRTLYLLGLAYELDGDEINAVHTYWGLWQNYPESPYALLAQAKLELKP